MAVEEKVGVTREVTILSGNTGGHREAVKAQGGRVLQTRARVTVGERFQSSSLHVIERRYPQRIDNGSPWHALIDYVGNHFGL